MEFAVIKTGGKQYIVKPKDKIKIEKLDKKIGDKIVFEDVLLKQKNEKLDLGEPNIEGAKVIAKVISQDKHKKVIIFKYKAKKRYKKKQGHRQAYTEVEILEIK